MRAHLVRTASLAVAFVALTFTALGFDTGFTLERALTLYLNAQEIVTMMTIGDFPDYLAVGYLF